MNEVAESKFSTRIVVEAGDDGNAGELGVRAAVARVLGDRGGGWRLERLFPGVQDSRCHVLAVGAWPPLPPQAAFDLSYALHDQPEIVRAEPDLPVPAYGHAPPVAPGAFGPDAPTIKNKQWALQAIRCHEAWDLAPVGDGGKRFGEGIRIGHPDTGYTSHPAFGDVLEALDLVADQDFINNDNNALDPLEKGFLPLTSFPGHGTATGSVIVARDSYEVSGVAPKATLIPMRAVKSVIQFFDSDVARAVEACRAAGCHIISMSLGGKGFFGLEEAIQRAVDAGIIVMAAAGNKVGVVTAPASYKSCIAVAATNHDDQPWAGSSRGRKVLISAPGGGVYAASWTLDQDPHIATIRPRSGTSFAVAHLAGAAALWLASHDRDKLLARYPGASLTAAFQATVSTQGFRAADIPDWDSTRFGVGILDAKSLLEAQLPVDATPIAAFAGDDSAAARIANALPELSTAEVSSRLDVAGLDAERFGAELLYHLLRSDSIRSNFSLEPDASGAFSDSWLTQLEGTASTTLGAQIRS